MENQEKEETNDSRNSVQAGLSGIDLKIDKGHVLRIDGMASNFRDGKGTKEEPLEPRASLHLETSLKDANYLAEFLKAHYDLNRTIYVRHGGRLLGVDADANVQFVRDQEWASKESWQREAEWLEDFMKNIKNEESNPKTWTLSAIDENKFD